MKRPSLIKLEFLEARTKKKNNHNKGIYGSNMTQFPKGNCSIYQCHEQTHEKGILFYNTSCFIVPRQSVRSGSFHRKGISNISLVRSILFALYSYTHFPYNPTI